MRLSLVPLAILLMPFAEIAGFIFVGQKIGLLATLGLVVLTSVIGAVLLRVQGFGIMRRIAQESSGGQLPGRDLIHAAMIFVAGVLLLLPGFITDIIGLLLFVPFIRDFAWKRLSSRIVVMGAGTGFRSGGPAPGRHSADRTPQPAAGPVVDLDDDDFRREPDPKSPWSDNRRIGD